jgi:hypothetical protein
MGGMICVNDMWGWTPHDSQLMDPKLSNNVSKTTLLINVKWTFYHLFPLFQHLVLLLYSQWMIVWQGGIFDKEWLWYGHWMWRIWAMWPGCPPVWMWGACSRKSMIQDHNNVSMHPLGCWEKGGGAWVVVWPMGEGSGRFGGMIRHVTMVDG